MFLCLCSLISISSFALMSSGLQRVLEQHYHSRKGSMKKWWHMLARVYFRHKGSFTPWRMLCLDMGYYTLPRQYLHINHFVLRIDHKPLNWLANVSNAHGWRGRWIDMLQDFNFKIVHRPKLRHSNVEALSKTWLTKLQMMMILMKTFRI